MIISSHCASWALPYVRVIYAFQQVHTHRLIPHTVYKAPHVARSTRVLEDGLQLRSVQSAESRHEYCILFKRYSGEDAGRRRARIRLGATASQHQERASVVSHCARAGMCASTSVS